MVLTNDRPPKQKRAQESPGLETLSTLATAASSASATRTNDTTAATSGSYNNNIKTKNKRKLFTYNRTSSSVSFDEQILATDSMSGMSASATEAEAYSNNSSNKKLKSVATAIAEEEEAMDRARMNALLAAAEQNDNADDADTNYGREGINHDSACMPQPQKDVLIASLPQRKKNVKVKRVLVNDKDVLAGSTATNTNANTTIKLDDGKKKNKNKTKLPGHRLLKLASQGARKAAPATPKGTRKGNGKGKSPNKITTPSKSPRNAKASLDAKRQSLEEDCYSPSPSIGLDYPNPNPNHNPNPNPNPNHNPNPNPNSAAATGTIWDPNPEIPKQPYKLDLPRSRYDDSMYASFSCQLIHILDGSGRQFAKFEFFYSDLDRQWYATNPMEKDLYRLGIPSPATMPCSFAEWRMLRRKIPHRVKRYSTKFVQTQLSKLQQYRDTIRMLQKYFHFHNTLPPATTATAHYLEYDVPALIAIGRTVTAYHKKAKILHRGIVLTRDLQRYGYLIQFERKELGCEFCPDYEVASHGPPRYIHQSSKTFDGTTDSTSTIGKLPHGTTFGPLVEYHKQNNKKALYQIKMEKIRRTNVVRALEFEEEDGERSASIHTFTKPPAPVKRLSVDMENMNILNSITEREIVIQFIHRMDGLIKRKERILQTLEACHTHYAATPNLDKYPHWSNHYKWLHANLNRTNISLECFQVLMQILYSKVYTGRPKALLLEQQHAQTMAQERRMQELFHPKHSSSGLNSSWLQTLYSQSLLVSTPIALPSSNTTPSTTITNTTNPRKQYISSRVLSSTSILLTIYYCVRCILLQEEERHDGNTPGVDSMQHVLFKLCTRFQPLELDCNNNTNNDNDDEKEQRQDAYHSFKESIKRLCAELAMFQVIDR